MADHGEHPDHAFDDRYQLLVNSVIDYAIYMLDADGRITTWNPGARRFKGYEPDEVIGENYARFFTPEDREAGLPQRQLEIASREGRFESEGWRVRKDGSRFWAHVVLDPVRRPDGELIGYAKITRDVTAKREAERALWESEQRFRMLIQGVRDYAIYMLDRDGRITNWNPGAEAIKGYTEDEILGEHFSRFYTDEDRANGEPEKALATALAKGKYERQAWRVRKNGEHFWASILIDPIYDAKGEHVGFAKITRDVTEQKRAEEELEQARAALAQAQKLQALGELTGGIAHDFNNLITVIRGSAELLRRADLNEERRRRYLDAITDTADRAATLTSHLLAFSRRQPLKPEVLDLNVRLDAFAEVLSRTLGSTIDVQLELAPGLWRVEADPTHLENALLNAAINARDAMPRGGRLTLSTANVSGSDGGGDMVCIALTDTGEGMPAEVIERAFEPFFTTKPVGKGTGLGLSQIHGFAAQSGGRAEIESVLGEGTTVRLLLPRSDGSVASAVAAKDSPALPPGLRVLLVEDNEQVSAFARDLLEDLGCAVVAAHSGEEALAELETGTFDLIFTDVVMPGLSGVELARQVRTRFPGLPVVLASGYSNEMLKGAALEFELLHKPYCRESLAEALAKVLAAVRRPAARGEA
ncbi:PAS domain S-box protein [Sphingomonas sp. MAH-20]|uniref:histidine kinase n=1 Tax=Sphingomonas horti TaxID=2682842 RepID=A0A6I4J0H4_9SPHN|nr:MULTISPECIES: PAS domain-containing sensor histidine kinase [Sphingomonas]MBA2919903.1 PAS domain S-box protein [Sphingomonas sp. CGMCC 1.13658]MVO77786.1 PAS domain S-box protein [Sphingomonas horti]